MVTSGSFIYSSGRSKSGGASLGGLGESVSQEEVSGAWHVTTARALTVSLDSASGLDPISSGTSQPSREATGRGLATAAWTMISFPPTVILPLQGGK